MGLIFILLLANPVLFVVLCAQDSLYTTPAPVDPYTLEFSTEILGNEEADSSDYFKPALDAYPCAFYTPETQLAFGGGGIFTFFTKKDFQLNPSKIVLSGFYSTVKTYELYAYSNLFYARNTIAANIDLTFAHTVDRYYGKGNDTPDLGNEEYILESYGGTLDFQLPPAIGMSDRSGYMLEYRRYSVVDRRENPYLQNDSLNGIQGGNISGMGIVWVWDKRNNVLFPIHGGLMQFMLLFYTRDFGSNYTYNWVELDLRRYWSYPSDHVLAVQIYLNAVGGNPPFYKLPALGGAKKYAGIFRAVTGMMSIWRFSLNIDNISGSALVLWPSYVPVMSIRKSRNSI